MRNNLDVLPQRGNEIRQKCERKRVRYIQRVEDYNQVIKEISGVRIIGVDLEADSFHRYYEKICLIQIGTPKNIYIIDPLAGLDISPVKEILEDPTVVKVMHDPTYDIALLKKTLSVTPRNIFDTSIAGQQLGFRKLGLDNLLKQVLQVEHSKKLNIVDWAKRPLPKEWITYAATDVRYLIELRNLFLEKLPRYEEFKEKCSQLERIIPKEKHFNPENFVKISGASELSSHSKEVLKALYSWRDAEARRQDRAPFMILDSKKLITIAKATIKTREDVKQLLGRKQRNDKTLYNGIFKTVRATQEGN
ncbi:MAG: ribonuclease D [Candidatus Heimdallarchaeota archaeon]